MDSLSEYQKIQADHDALYHDDIISPGFEYQLNHIALHFIKYTAVLHAGKTHPDFSRVFIDTFIMAVSASCILDLDISLTIAIKAPDFFKSYLNEMSCFSDQSLGWETKKGSVFNIIAMTLGEAEIMNIDLINSACNRLKQVEGIYHKKLALAS